MNILLCGSHERNTDTIILLHANLKLNKIILLSIPRDIYHKDRKINDIYKTEGPEALIKELSLITGLNITKYLIIDMYAFIDVINILGGIQITLEDDLIDPTYKIKENGEWTSLYYKRGTHNLNGIQSLRIARSRNYTSDFSRARRQQKILAAVKNKITNADISKRYKILVTLLKYVDSNINPFELSSYINKYKDLPFSNFNIISTNNVLYQTFSEYGAWILLPNDDNWDLIKSYVGNLIK